MILVTHGVVGGALAATAGLSPFWALVVGFISHFVLDFIPHWDYHLRSADHAHDDPLHHDIRLGYDFLIDLAKIGLDVGLGFAVPLLIGLTRDYSPQQLLAIVFGVVGAILPDFLQFAYFKIRRQPLTSLQRFHIWIHANKKIKDWRIGLALQLILILAVVAVLFV